ncbi:MFS transporter [Peptoniphilus asaccharolyticus]
MKNLKLKYFLTQSIFWMLMACLTSYINVTLTGRGISVSKIGIIAAIGSIIAAFFGPFISQMCEVSKTKKEREYMIFVILISILSLISSLIFRSPIIAVLVLILIPNILIISLQPLLNSLGMTYMQLDHTIDFSKARGIGAFSYAVCSLVLGKMSVGNSDMPIIFSIVLFTILFAIMLSQPHIEKVEISETQNNFVEQDTPFTKREAFAAIVGVILLFVFYQINHSFMLQIMESLGGNSSHMGLAFSIAAFSETIAMFALPLFLKKYNLISLFKFSALMFILKGILTYFSPSVGILLAVQFSQVVGFGIFTPVSVYLFSRKFPSSMRIRAQGYLTSSITLGGVFGLLSGGILVENLGIGNTILVSMAFAVIGTISIFTIKK